MKSWYTLVYQFITNTSASLPSIARHLSVKIDARCQNWCALPDLMRAARIHSSAYWARLFWFLFLLWNAHLIRKWIPITCTHGICLHMISVRVPTLRINFDVAHQFLIVRINFDTVHRFWQRASIFDKKVSSNARTHQRINCDGYIRALLWCDSL